MRALLPLLLALAVAAAAADGVVNSYESREEYAAIHNIEVASTLEEAGTPAACKSKKTFMKDTGAGGGRWPNWAGVQAGGGASRGGAHRPPVAANGHSSSKPKPGVGVQLARSTALSPRH